MPAWRNADKAAEQGLTSEEESDPLAYEMDDDPELKKHLDGVIAFDREKMEKFDLPADVLEETSTDKLFLHFIQSPLRSFISLYTGENEKIGVQRLINASSTVHEFYMREDLASP